MVELRACNWPNDDSLDLTKCKPFQKMYVYVTDKATLDRLGAMNGGDRFNVTIEPVDPA